jgi:hypothetical protein
MLQGEADAAIAEERIGLVGGAEIRRHLVAAQIHGPEDHRSRRETLGHRPVRHELLLLARQLGAVEIEELGSEEPDRVGARGMGLGGLRGQLDVDAELDPMTVAGLGRQIVHGEQLAIRLGDPFPPHRDPRARGLVGAELDLATRAIHHRQVTGARRLGRALDRHHRRDAATTRDDRRVRGAATRLEYEAEHALAVEQRHVAGRDVVRDQYAGLGDPREAALPAPDQITQHPTLDVEHVGATFAQVLVLDPAEPRRHPAHVVAEHHAGVAVLVADPLQHRASQVGIVEHHQVRVVDRGLGFAQLGGDAVADLLEIASRASQGVLEERDLVGHPGRGDRELAHRELLGHHHQDGTHADSG